MFPLHTCRPKFLLPLIALFAILICSIEQTGFNATAAANDTAPLRIGVSLGLSGRYASITRLQQYGFRLWEKHVNQRGGILGRKVELIIRDDKSDPATAARIYEQLIQHEKVDFVFGPYSSPVTLAIAPVVEKYGYPTLASGAASEEIWRQGYQNLFGMWPPAGRYAVGFLSILDQAGIKRVGIVTVDDAFSRAVAEGAKKWSVQFGLEVTNFEVEPKKNPDFMRAAERCRRAGAQALLLTGHFEEAVQMRRVLARLNWSPRAFYATVGPALQRYRDEVADDAEGVFSTSIWEPREDLRQRGAAEFLRAFKAAYNELPSYHAAHAYAAGQILEEAITRAGSTEHEAVRKTLSDLDTESIVGRYAVDRTGIQIKQFALILQWQGGKREIVWPRELSTAKPILSR